MNHPYHVDGPILRINTARGYVLMDASDEALLLAEGFKLTTDTYGIRVWSNASPIRQYLARLITTPEEDEVITFVNGDRMDCRRTNLCVTKRYVVRYHVEGETLRIELKDGRHVLMDANDASKVAGFHISIHRDGYVFLTAQSPYVTLSLARTVMQTPVNMWCDHISGDRLDNRKKNLRNCTPAQNAQNCKKATRGRSSPFKGVSYGRFLRGTKKWRAEIMHNGTPYFLGCFMTAEEAASAYNAKAIEMFGEFARLNLLDRPRETISVLNMGGD